MSPADRAALPRHRGGLSSAVRLGAPSRMSALLTVLWLAAGPPRAPLEPARRPQLGRGHDAAVGALSRRSGCPTSIRGAATATVAESLRSRAAARRLRREPQSRRRAAGAVQVLREPRDRARGERADRPLQRAPRPVRPATMRDARSPDGWAVRLERAAPRRRHRSATSSTCGRRREIHRRSRHRRHRRRRRQRLGVVPAREVRAARRARRRRRRTRRQHHRRSPIATSTR